ncbi:MAG: hypothetical protein KDE27_02955 [Planctomycetes bacterium]|nr:hypothetical protein [Planctomycetota bacterium]
MRFEELIVEVVKWNGAEQHYACCTAFLDMASETRLTTDDLVLPEMWGRTRGQIGFGIERAGDKSWVTLGPVLVLRPTPEYSRMTRAGVEEPYRWQFDQRDLLDQTDDICGGWDVRLVAAQMANGKWGVRFSDQLGITTGPHKKRRRTAISVGETLEKALWAAVRGFRNAPLRPPTELVSE